MAEETIRLGLKQGSKKVKNMNQEVTMNTKPFLSISMIIFALFVVVFCKMEVRRLGYLVLKQARQEKNVQDEKRLVALQYASLIRPERIESYAQNYWSLARAQQKQIVLISMK